ncbi:MBL fold metallo-hydrolase [Brevundimonas sp. 2R-24]|uniref:MBL fold metallo-hydrolase n=1 Tax=Peiella sedimenti TaxID=3061083 RepID=A0ABT8SP38_9CAUL|nr:MBL fold metallo-hydrolase [Caulobacteraceae bacterium XZ-24]
MTRLIVVTSLLAAIAAPGAAHQTPPPDPASPEAVGARLRGHYQMIEPVAERVHMIRQIEPFQVSVLGNIGVIEQSDGLVLFDAGGDPAATRRALRMIATFSEKPVKAVIISHWHSDHFGGLGEIVDRWPSVRIIAHEQTLRNLTELGTGLPAQADLAGEPDTFGAILAGLAPIRAAQAAAGPELGQGYEDLIALSMMTGRDSEGARLVLPTETFTDRLVLDDAVAPIEVIHLGNGNTSGEALAWLSRQRVLFTGDTVVGPFPYGIAAFPTSWRRVLGQIDAMDYAVLVPGHGEMQRDHTYVRAMMADMDELNAFVTPLARAGVSLEDIRARRPLARQAEAFAQGDAWKRKWFYRYWIDPLIGCMAAEARGETIAYPVGSATCTGPGSLGF